MERELSQVYGSSRDVAVINVGVGIEFNSDILGRLCLNIYTQMAVPKKKTSKSKRDKRRATWRNKAAIQAKKALSLGKSVLTGRSTSFVYPQPDEEDTAE